MERLEAEICELAGHQLILPSTCHPAIHQDSRAGLC